MKKLIVSLSILIVLSLSVTSTILADDFQRELQESREQAERNRLKELEEKRRLREEEERQRELEHKRYVEELERERQEAQERRREAVDKIKHLMVEIPTEIAKTKVLVRRYIDDLGMNVEQVIESIYLNSALDKDKLCSWESRLFSPDSEYNLVWE